MISTEYIPEISPMVSMNGDVFSMAIFLAPEVVGVGGSDKGFLGPPTIELFF